MDMNPDDYIGRSTGNAVITLERGPVSQFAVVVTDRNPIYADAAKARAAGFRNIPVPPTYFFSAGAMWGAFPEDQPADAVPEKDPMMEVMGTLFAKGGMILHGEEEFIYHRDVCVGDVLTSAGKVVDLYEKPSGERIMTFLVTENEYRNQDGELVLTARMNLIHRR